MKKRMLGLGIVVLALLAACAVDGARSRSTAASPALFSGDEGRHRLPGMRAGAVIGEAVVDNDTKYSNNSVLEVAWPWVKIMVSDTDYAWVNFDHVVACWMKS
jgi:hypothetical protein